MFNNSVTPLLIWIITTVLMFSSQGVASTTCDADTCKNGGTCDASSGTVVCTCAPGWDGSTCEDVSCTNNPCLNKGTCKVESGALECTCAPGWGGGRCADASGASTISGHFLLLTVVAVLAKLNLN